MRNEQVAHMRSAVVAFSIGATLTMAACAQDAPAPSDPTRTPQQSAPVVNNYPNYPSPVAVPAPTAQFAPGGSVPPVAGTPPTDIAIGEIGPQPQPGEEIVTVPDGDWRYLAPPESGTPPPNGDIVIGPPAPESPESPLIIGDEAPDTGPINGE